MHMKIFSAAMLMCLLSTNASAFTDCWITPTHVYTGAGFVWISYSNGGAGMMYLTNQNASQVFSMAMTAVVTGKMLRVRYTADGVSCTSQQIMEGAALSTSQ